MLLTLDGGREQYPHFLTKSFDTPCRTVFLVGMSDSAFHAPDFDRAYLHDELGQVFETEDARSVFPPMPSNTMRPNLLPRKP